MRREIGTYMFCPHPKMPVLSSLIGICAFAETYRNRLAFDEVMLRNQMLGNSIADVVHKQIFIVFREK